MDITKFGFSVLTFGWEFTKNKLPITRTTIVFHLKSRKRFLGTRDYRGFRSGERIYTKSQVLCWSYIPMPVTHIISNDIPKMMRACIKKSRQRRALNYICQDFNKAVEKISD